MPAFSLIDKEKQCEQTVAGGAESFEVDRDIEEVHGSEEEPGEPQPERGAATACVPESDAVNRKYGSSKAGGSDPFEEQVVRPENMQREQQQVNDLNMFAEKESLIEVTAKAFSMPDVPEMLFVHRGITVRHEQTVIELSVHPEGCTLPDDRENEEEHQGSGRNESRFPLCE